MTPSWSPTAARSPCGSSAPCATWESARWRCSATPTPEPATSRRLTSRYDWGSYQPSVARLYSDQSPGALADDRQRLVAEVRKTESRGKLKVPPGKYAHIGYLCYLSGDRDAARTYFEAEGRSYPESAKLMNDMIGRLQ